MALSINYPDKILAGVNQSYTVTSDEGLPRGQVMVGGKALDHRVVELGAPKDSIISTTLVRKYKVSFFLPKDSVGKSLTLQFQAGSSKVDESKPVTET